MPMKMPDEDDFGDSEAYPRRDCWRNACRGRRDAVLRAEVLKVVAAGVDLIAARAKVRADEAIVTVCDLCVPRGALRYVKEQEQELRR